MRIVTVGGGPAGLYFSLLIKKHNPEHDVRVIERNAPDATYGWGVVFSEETLGALRDADRPTYDEIVDAFAKWNAIDVHFRGETIRSRGHGFSGISRKTLLGILQRRCGELGVELDFRNEVSDLEELDGADLIIGADGVNSGLRKRFERDFGPTIHEHSTKYVWFGTDVAFKAFTFIFRQSEHGLFQVHAYPFDATTSTFIVECHESTWRKAGLDEATEEDSIAYCEKLFADDLDGHSLLSNRSNWVSFLTLKNESWHRGNVVLVGDAAHTAHFTIGSGTKLAMEDSIALMDALEREDDLGAALVRYELERQPVVERLQEAALESARYFENVKRYANFEPIQFEFNLLTRSGRITHLELQRRDPQFISSVDAWFAGQHAGARESESAVVIAPPPMFQPLSLRGVELANRVVLSPTGEDSSADGVLGTADRERLLRVARRGAGLVRSDFVAVSAHGRISPGTPGLYRDEHAEAWSEVVRAMHESGRRAGVVLGHAGPRGATRPRRDGVDRPLREGAWPLLAASRIPYTKMSQKPHDALEKMADVIEDFLTAAQRAAQAGFDVLEIHLGHGYLLASFISPLTNKRTDEYGGTFQNRIRFPLRAFDAVREVWPRDRVLAASITASDWRRGGTEPGDAVQLAATLKEHGCDLVHVLAGQTTVRETPNYGRLFLVPFSDQIRNEAEVPTVVGGNITTANDINTILAAGRADLCILTA
ncbi:MAG: FAD-dependent monooxygenase [Actinomycetota bacterium]|nr:FAD-dependent monooxygenase [Actinomycetota bacterium]